ncbi:uncharacterized protein PRCAT00005165001 [Priceomyces carsonii]|uniref:uncharacterized protein n=1 Tax=Priceomyces carsonii TaxID=28549 RepID=UPI002EDB6F6A|nr:unnamed protein product [Priceomyces carsonii]
MVTDDNGLPGEVTEGNSSIEVVNPATKTKYSAPNENIDDVNKALSEEFLEPSNKLPWDLLDLMDSLPQLDKNDIYDGLLNIPNSITRTTFRMKRRGIHGKIEDCKEELRLSDLDNANSGNSMSMTRKVSSRKDALRGQTSFLPFQPGGLVENSKIKTKVSDETIYLHRNELGLFDIPQGLSRGLKLSGLVSSDEQLTNLEQEDDDTEQSIDNENISNLINADSTLEQRPVPSSITKQPFNTEEIDGLVDMDFSAMRNNFHQGNAHKQTWAHVVDLDHKLENFDELVPHMAREWPFELDTFQQEAVYHLEQGDSVFVAAHTSAGKTVVAEYAIAMANRNMTKAIYTSPIKALSNQKFRDFKETFKDIDVGLITGDVQINPDANCLIMTTEILRSMLYRGSDLIRDVEFVIFDEVHYVNDIDRGVVWEEVIIMLPDHVKYVLLSATVPNTFEFANWVGRTKQKDMYVISTPKRPVPLEIFIWAKNDIYKVINSQRQFVESEFKKHREALEKKPKTGPPNVVMGPGSRGGRGGTARGGNSRMATRGRGNFLNKPTGKSGFMRDGPNKNTWITLMHYLKNHNLLPAVVFVFSKKKCEEYADTLNNIDFCTAAQKSEIHMFVDRAVARLKKEDRELPQILKIRDLLSRGIAVHHGGLLPIVKECIEILFSKSLVKALFATETFAMGLNLPTRTVVFSSMRKHDGREFRNLLPGEFTQMSGRAGRRGLDATGTVIVMAYNDPIAPTDFKQVTLGTPTKLLSQFRLTYNMILNLLRIEALRVEEMIKHSFSENSTQVLLPEHQKTVKHLKEQLSQFNIEPCLECDLNDLSHTFELLRRYERLYGDIFEHIQELSAIRNSLLKIGRLLCYKDNSGSLHVGFLIRSDPNTDSVLVLTFDHGKEYEDYTNAFKLPYIPIQNYLLNFFKKIKFSGSLKVDSIPFQNVNFIARYAMKAQIKDVLQNLPPAVKEASEQIKIILRLQNKWEEVKFSQVTQLSLHELLEKKKLLIKDIEQQEFCSNFRKHYAELLEQENIKSQINSLQRLISDENLELLPDYEQRLDVLESLGFVDQNHNVVLKGRVACEINSGWELVITELVLDNFLGDFEPEEIVALLSCFVYEGKTNEEEDQPISPRLEKGKGKILEIMQKLLKVFNDKNVVLLSEEEEFLERKRFALVNVVYEWARGLSFNEIMQISVEAEGTIVRVITRLDEICREVKNAALIVGDSVLHSKMSDAQERIKRDIVFCASLYL